MIFIYNRDEIQVDVLDIEPKFTEEISKLNTLEFETYAKLEKGYRVVYKQDGKPYEFIIIDSDYVRNDDVLFTYFCQDSLTELNAFPILDKRPQGSYKQALTSAFENTRWQLVFSADFSEAYTQNNSFYHISVLEAFSKVAEDYNIEWHTEYTYSGSKITGRKLVISKLGTQSNSRLEFGKNIKQFSRKISSEPIFTALYGYGKGEETETGGYGRRISFADINGGLDYVTNEEARLKYGIGPTGSKEHLFGFFIDEEETDKTKLLESTRKELERVSQPQAEYTIEAVNLHIDCGIGDTVPVIDDELGFRGNTRIIKVVNQGGNKEFTFGQVQKAFTDSFQKEIQKSAEATEIKITSIMETRLNQIADVYFGEDGYNYDLKVGNEYGLPAGLYSFDAPIDQDPTKVVYMGAGKVLIADSKDANGAWAWKTALDGQGIVGSSIVAHSITANKLAADVGQSLDLSSNVSITQTVKSETQSYIDANKDQLKGEDGSTPYVEGGYWYINGVSTGIKAEGQDGVGVKHVEPLYAYSTSATPDFEINRLVYEEPNIMVRDFENQIVNIAGVFEPLSFHERTDYIKINAGDIVNLFITEKGQALDNGFIRYAFYDANKVLISGEPIETKLTNHQRVAPSNASYIVVSAPNDSNTTVNINGSPISKYYPPISKYQEKEVLWTSYGVGKNIIDNSSTVMSSGGYQIGSFTYNDVIVGGEQYTVSINGDIGGGATGWYINRRVGTTYPRVFVRADMTKNSEGWYVRSWAAPIINNQTPTDIGIIYRYPLPPPGGDGNISTVRRLKIERGDIPTPYTISPADHEARKTEHLWQRQMIIFTDGRVELTKPSPVHLANDGAPGRGITDTKYRYAKTSTPSPEPTESQWLITKPTYNKGDYAWTQVIWEYSDGTSENSAPMMSYIAEDGVGISNTLVAYALSTTNVQPSDSLFSSKVPDSKPGDYVWTRVTLDYTDPSKTDTKFYTSARVGKDGTDGATPYIGTNGNWWINGVDTGVQADVAPIREEFESYRIQTDKAITDRVTKTEYNNFKSSTNSALDGKVAKTVYDSFVSNTAASLESKVSETTYSSDQTIINSRFSSIEQTASQIALTVEEKGKYRNLIPNSDGFVASSGYRFFMKEHPNGNTTDPKAGSIVVRDSDNSLGASTDWGTGTYHYNVPLEATKKVDNYTLWLGNFFKSDYVTDVTVAIIDKNGYHYSYTSTSVNANSVIKILKNPNTQSTAELAYLRFKVTISQTPTSQGIRIYPEQIALVEGDVAKLNWSMTYLSSNNAMIDITTKEILQKVGDSYMKMNASGIIQVGGKDISISGNQVTLNGNTTVNGTFKLPSTNIADIAGWEISSTRLSKKTTSESHMTVLNSDRSFPYVMGTFQKDSSGSYNNMQWSIDWTGKLYARGADITGTINVTDGSIGGLSITSGGLAISGTDYYAHVSSTSSYPFFAGTSSSSSRFRVSRDGDVLARSITLTGGKVGGTTINSSSLSGGSFSSGSFTTGSYSGSSYGYGSFTSGNYTGNGYLASGSTLAGYSVTTQNSSMHISSLSCDTLNFNTKLRGWHSGTPQGYYTDATLRPSGWSFSNSDIRLKENIEELTDEYNKYIYDLPLIKYNYKSDEKHNPQVGVNANLLMKILPEEMAKSFLHQDEETGLYGANYELLVPYAIKAIQDLNKRLERLENE